jgi:SAM-dependent methyltransferase
MSVAVPARRPLCGRRSSMTSGRSASTLLLVYLASRRAREGGLSVGFTEDPATDLPFSSEPADVVLMPELLLHVVEWERFLDEEARVLKAGGLQYLCTLSRLCPRQQEFNLRLISWYPGRANRWCEKKVVTTRPQSALYACCPAIHRFSYDSLRRWFVRRGFRTLDRFGLFARHSRFGLKRVSVSAMRITAIAGVLGRLVMEGTTLCLNKTALPQDN